MAADKNNDLSFWGHLDALRGVILRVVAVLAVLAVAFFVCMPWIFDHIITAPCEGSFPVYHLFEAFSGDGTLLPDMGRGDFHVELINIQLASQFMVHMSASMWCAFIVGFPVVVYLLWTFVAPGLYEHEKAHARAAFLWGNVMFYLGMAVGYFVVFPMALRFLADYHLSDKIANTVSLTSYMDTFFMLVLMMGILFELPLLAWLLGKMGLIKREIFSRYRKYAFTAILVVSGIVTPTSDLMTLALVFVPIYALWEASAFLVPRGGAATP